MGDLAFGCSRVGSWDEVGFAIEGHDGLFWSISRSQPKAKSSSFFFLESNTRVKH